MIHYRDRITLKANIGPKKCYIGAGYILVIPLLFDYPLLRPSVARVLEDDRSILPRRSGSEKAFHGAARALLRRTALVAGLRKGAHPSIAACRRLTYEALVTLRFCAVDSNSTRHGRNRRGFKKKKKRERKKESGGGRARARERGGAAEGGREWQSRTGKRG